MTKQMMIILTVVAILALVLVASARSESFNVDSYIRPNYESGANMLRGDLAIMPVNHGWFNTRYGPTSLAPGFFEYGL